MDGPFRALQVKKRTVTVDANWVHFVVFFDRITLSETAGEAMKDAEIERHDDVLLEAGNTGEEYVVERIVLHEDNKKRIRYIVRWYG